MKYTLFIIGVVLFISSCTQGNQGNIIGKWHEELTFADGKLNAKSQIVYKNDNTFDEVDTFITENKNVYVKLYKTWFNTSPQDSNNNNPIVVKCNGTWDLKGNLDILTLKWINTTDFKNLPKNDTNRIISLTEDTCIYLSKFSKNKLIATKINDNENADFHLLLPGTGSILCAIIGLVFWRWRRRKNKKFEEERDLRVAQTTEKPKVKICPFCKEEIKIDAIKCRFCGEMLDKKN